MPPGSYPYYEWSLSSSSDVRTFGIEPPTPFMTLGPDDYATLQQQQQQSTSGGGGGVGSNVTSPNRSHGAGATAAATGSSTTTSMGSLEDMYYVRRSVLPSHALTSCLRLYVHRLVTPRYIDLCGRYQNSNDGDDDDNHFYSNNKKNEGNDELRVTASIYGMGIPLHGTNTPSSTVACHKIPERRRMGMATITTQEGSCKSLKPPPLPSILLSGDDDHHDDLYWEEELSFPVRYKDTFRDSCIVINVIGPCGRQMYGTTLPLYDSTGKLRMGKVKLRLYRGQKGHPCVGVNRNGCRTPGLHIGPTSHLGQQEEEKNLENEQDDDDSSNDYLWKAETILDDIQQRRQWVYDQQMWQDELQKQQQSSDYHTRPRASWVTSSLSTTPVKPPKTSSSQQPSTTTRRKNSSSSSSSYWLDNLTEQRCLEILGDTSSSSFCHMQSKNNNVSNDNDDDNDDNYMPTLTEGEEEDLYFSSLDPHDAEYIQATEAHLIVELPTFPITVVHEELLYGPPIHGASGSVTALDVSLYNQRKEALNLLTKRQELQQQQKQSNKGDSDGGDTSASVIPNTTPQLELLRSKITEEEEGGIHFIEFLDPENVDDNPAEDMHRMMSHDLLRGVVDPSIKPDKHQRTKIDSIISSPSHHLTTEEKDFLWKFRFSLVDNRKALTKFLLAVEWNEETEVIQAAELLEQWRKRSPIAVTDALKLLGKDVAFQTSLVRGYAIDTLADAPDEELQLYLLQLVQALKYEDITLDDMIGRGGLSLKETKGVVGSSAAAAAAARSRDASLANFLIDRASTSLMLANFLYWYLKVEMEDPVNGDRYAIVFSSLRKRLSNIHNYRTFTMWDRLTLQDHYITNLMECQMLGREERGRKDVKERKCKALMIERSLERVKDHMSIPLPSEPHIMINGVKASSTFMFKSAMYPAVMEFNVEQQDSFRSRTTVASELFLKRTFAALDNSNDDDLLKEEDEDDADTMEASPNTASTKSNIGSTYKVILKTGDDLRQDQLVMMLIKLMDGLLKKGTLDLRLRPYSILATSPTSGLVEFVSGSIPISQILANHNNSILQYLQSVAPFRPHGSSSSKTPIKSSPSPSKASTPTSASSKAQSSTFPMNTATGQTSTTNTAKSAAASNNGNNHNNNPGGGPLSSSSASTAGSNNNPQHFLHVQPDVMNTYIRSCAGYCVITYLLGVGDRHLDNIMLLPTGHLFHIDFGFIFGRDPKPLPPPFRLTREMVDGMGGVESSGYKKFCALACQAFNILRKHAGLVLNLLNLMSDAGIEDLSNNPTADSEGIINKVAERFRLELTEEQAEHFFSGLIKESLDAFAPRVMEVFHQISVARR